ncbi:hypothetical protein [Aneurinibacillus aneurinilyticus]|uniref:hypothetical protein n=1 Tax=Aneurinibacillus aneurinilyticus TaxID=1391 RepID=UPI0023F4DEB2|nr:hypothetical protein [Aneurinibacillus aneurinilyticus]
MRKPILLLLAACTITVPFLTSYPASAMPHQTEQHNNSVQPQSKIDSQAEITKGGRGGRGGVGITPRRPADGGYRSRYEAPVTRPTPSSGIGRGLWAFGLGALFGSILHPFSGAYGFGFSFIGLLFWALVLFMVYKYFRRFFSRTKT